MGFKNINQLFFALTLVLFTLISAQAQDEQNIIVNPGFEEGINAWSARKCVISSSSEQVMSGNYSLVISSREKIFGGAQQVITDSLLRKGQGKYIVSACFRTAAGEDTAKISLRLTVNDEYIRYRVEAPVNADGWVCLKDTLNITWDTAPSEADIYLQTKNDMSLDYYVDNIAMIPDSVYGGIEPPPDSGATSPPDDPILPHDYAAMLGPGFDVSWTKHDSHAAEYSEALVIEMKNKGFTHIRLRTNWEDPQKYISVAEPMIKDCIKNGIIPVLAFGGQSLEENVTPENIEAFVNWWRTVADHFKYYSHKVSYNLLIEISGELKNMPDSINSIYEKTVTAIRETNPDRIVILGPRKLSNPFYLHELNIPTQANGYLMWEWHFYASGPSKTNETKLWTTGTPEERKLITDKINAGLDWENETGYPSWVGAWMPGDYTADVKVYTTPEQVIFSSFMVRELNKAGVPWAINAIHHFHGFWEGFDDWYDFRKPVRDVVVDPWKAVLYAEENYGGESKKLAPGAYDKTFLEENNLLNNIKSVMIPLDYKIKTYSGEGFTGTEHIYSETDSSIVDGGDILSLIIEYDSTATAIANKNGNENIIKNYRLYQNYPNPFNPNTRIKFALPKKCDVNLSVYNLLGQKVAVLLNQTMEAGYHEVVFNGGGLSNGVYFYRLESGKFSAVKKLILMK